MNFVYRPEIDGLRALAVISVILYHLELNFVDQNLFTGGFIGVDIFFVISGYLITSIIMKDITSNKKFSFLNFYERRARRILPVLLVVLLFTLLISFFLFTHTKIKTVSESVIYSLGFTSNFLFWFKNLQYGAEAGFAIPLLHTWSLSVEEQFYIIFPLALIISLKFFKKQLLKIIFLLITLNLVVIQFGGNLNLNYPYFEGFKFQAPTFFTSFMITFSRVWELLVGVFLGILENRYGKYKSNNILSNSITTISLFVILCVIFIFNHYMFYPSFITLIPVVCTALLIIFCNKDNIITKLFSLKILVYIGLISYSLYLWHYIFLVFYRFYFVTTAVDHKLLIILLSVFVSILSYNYIEKPFRNSNSVNRKKFTLVISATLMFIIATCILISKDVFKKIIDNKYVISNVYIGAGYYGDKIDEYFKKVKNNNFNKNDNKKVLLIGNSFSRDLYMGFMLNNKLFSKFEFAYWDTQIYCLNQLILKTHQERGCNISNHIKNTLKEADNLIISTKWLPKDLVNLEKSLFLMKKNNKKILILSHRPEFETIYNYTIYDKFLLKNKRIPTTKEREKLESIYYDSYKKNLEIKKNNIFLERIALKSKVNYFDVEKVFCSDQSKKCKFSLVNDKKIYYDFGHLTLEGVKFLTSKINDLNIL